MSQPPLQSETQNDALVRSATKLALSTTELLEAILVHLDMKSLLHAQRVSQGWKDTITGSLQLQRHLFMAPAKIADMMQLAKAYAQDKLIFLDDSHFIRLAGGIDRKSRAAQGCPNTAMVNPLLKTYRAPYGFTGDVDPRFDVAHMLDLDNGVEPSWKRMCLTQPPTLVVTEPCLGRTALLEGKTTFERGQYALPVRRHTDNGSPMQLGDLMESVEKEILDAYGSEVDWQGSFIKMEGMLKSRTAVERNLTAASGNGVSKRRRHRGGPWT